MGRFVDRIQAFALALGGPGLFLTAFLDSSFLSLPEINDLLLIYMVTQHKSLMLYYASCVTLGSIAGCLVMYYIGRSSDKLVRKMGEARVERAKARIQRWGVMAILVPSLLPPPAPFKIFVLLAGVAGISVGRFVFAVAVGRGIRYFGEGILALYYGDQAIAFIHDNGRAISLGLVAVMALGIAAYVVAQRLRRPGTTVN
jgi:membrane protein YqaA with SNARE-associated domain